MARLLCLVVTLFLSLGFAAAQSQNSVTIRNTGLLPEGLDYSAASLSFYTTSLSQGGIYTVSDAGVVTPFGDAGKKTVSTAGIQVDDKRGLLYVCNTDAIFPNPTNKGSVVAVSQDDGSIAFIARFDNLGKNNTAAKLINDVVQDSRGNLYATDSYNGAIYKYDVDAKKASLFVQDPILAPQDSTGLGVNGIDYYNNGGLEYLLVTRSGQNVANSGLFRIPLKTPSRITRVTINVPVSYNPPSGLDGAFLDPTNNERIYVVGNSILYSLETRDDWSSATVTKNLGAKETSTSLTFVGGSYNKVYVMSLNGFGPGPYSIDRYSMPYTAGPVNNDGDSSSASMLAFSPFLLVVLLLVNFLF